MGETGRSLPGLARSRGPVKELVMLPGTIQALSALLTHARSGTITAPTVAVKATSAAASPPPLAPSAPNAATPPPKREDVIECSSASSSAAELCCKVTVILVTSFTPACPAVQYVFERVTNSESEDKLPLALKQVSPAARAVTFLILQGVSLVCEYCTVPVPWYSFAVMAKTPTWYSTVPASKGLWEIPGSLARLAAR